MHIKAHSIECANRYTKYQKLQKVKPIITVFDIEVLATDRFSIRSFLVQTNDRPCIKLFKLLE